MQFENRLHDANRGGRALQVGVPLQGNGLPKEPASPPVKESCYGYLREVPMRSYNKKAASNGRRLLRAPCKAGRQSRPRRFHGAGEVYPIPRRCQKQGPPNFRTRGLKCRYGRLLSLVRRGPEFLGPGLYTSMAIHAVPTALYHNVFVVSRNGRLKTLYVSPSYFTEPSMPRPAKIPVNIPQLFQ